MEIVAVKVPKAALKYVKDTLTCTDEKALQAIQRILTNYLNTEEFKDAIFNGEI